MIPYTSKEKVNFKQFPPLEFWFTLSNILPLLRPCLALKTFLYSKYEAQEGVFLKSDIKIIRSLRARSTLQPSCFNYKMILSSNSIFDKTDVRNFGFDYIEVHRRNLTIFSINLFIWAPFSFHTLQFRNQNSVSMFPTGLSTLHLYSGRRTQMTSSE